MNTEITELLEHYENGLFTRPEIVSRLVEFSVTIDPDEYIPFLEESLREEMKEKVKEPPKAANEIYFLGGGSFKAGRSELEIELSHELQKVKAFGSAWRLHVYFCHA